MPNSGGDGPAPAGYYCSQVHPYSYDCLTTDRWSALLEFAADTGLLIALGLNGCFGRMSADTPMDFSNAKKLFAATAASPYASRALWGFELTNEVVPNTISAAAWGRDIAVIKSLAAAAFAAEGLPPPPVVGPDQGGSAAITDVAQATAHGVLAAYTYHQYPQCAFQNSSFVLEPACLQQLDDLAVAGVAASRLSLGGPPYPAVWLGEGADHSGGGVLNLTDTFRSSFYYAWLLATLPLNGVELAARQCLSGGDYELLLRDGFRPNPDYWIAYFFRNLLAPGGAAAFRVTQNVTVAESGVRVFAFDANAALLGRPATFVIALNLQVFNNPAITLDLGELGLRARREWVLSTWVVAAPHANVMCNGKAMVLDPGTDAPPPVLSMARAVAGGTVELAPATMVFLAVDS